MIRGKWNELLPNSRRKNVIAPTVLMLLFTSMALYLGASGRVFLETGWSGDNVESIYDSGIDALVIADSIFFWGDEEGVEQPFLAQLINDPDDPNRYCLYLSRAYADDDNVGMGKMYSPHPLSLRMSDAIRIRYRTEGPVAALIQLEESDDVPVWPPENWQRVVLLNSPEWRTVSIPISTFRLNPDYQPHGEFGDEILNVEHIGSVYLNFPPEQDVRLYLSGIFVDRTYFAWASAAGLGIMLVWWFIAVYFVTTNIQHPNAVFYAEFLKFCLYAIVLLLADASGELGYAFLALAGLAALESALRFGEQNQDRAIRILNHASPWLAAGILAVAAPVATFAPLLIAAHCLHGFTRMESRSISWAAAHHLMAVLALSLLAPRDASLGLIAVSIFLLAGFVALMLHQRNQEQLEAERLAAQTLFVQQIERSRQIEGIGRMAAGVAHQFNNLLTGVIGNLNLAQIRSSVNTRDHIVKARQSADQAAQLVQKLLLFGRQFSPRKSPLQVNDTLKQVKTLFAQSSSSCSFVLNYHLADSLPMVEADPHFLRSVIFDMLLNARDSIEEAAKNHLDRQFAIHVQSTVVENASSLPMELNESEVQRFIKISITDNGIGMDQDTKKRIFEPFFTTKDAQRAAGLSLASAHGIIQEHGGWIEVDSEPNDWTAFHIYLPCLKSSCSKNAISA